MFVDRGTFGCATMAETVKGQLEKEKKKTFEQFYKRENG